MQHECYCGRTLREAMTKVRSTLGEDAMILSSRSGETQGKRWAEIAAAPASVVEAFRRSLDPNRVGVGYGMADDEAVDHPAPSSGATVTGAGASLRDGLRIGPRLIALVGPPGAGKTLTAVKLALSPHAFAAYRTGFITLDTYRVGAVDQLQAYAEIAGVPLEVVYSRREVAGAVARLRNCQVVVVDTPGRTPDTMGRFGPWEDVLRQIAPHEVHLVIPAGIRNDVARHLRASAKELAPTHVLPSKLDHVPGDVGLAEMVETVGLPARWVADGHEVPGSLRPATPRILAALGRGLPGSAGGIDVRAAS